ncbi:MAG: flagellar hook-length control protein FliK [Lentisphaerae bacterium]|nr:flagellar hook-length control protein FliK [Lentisphaerota bacterium]
MTQNLSGIEPVKAEGCEGVSLGLFGRTAKGDGFAPLPDPVVAERFQSAIADECDGVSVSMKPPQDPAIEFNRRHEDASSCQEVLCPDVAQTLSDSGKTEICGGKSSVERVGDAEGVKDGIAVSEKPNQSAGVGSEWREGAPSYQEEVIQQNASHSQGAVVLQDASCPQKDVAPQAAGCDVGELSKVAGRVVTNAPEMCAPWRGEDTPPRPSASVLRDVPSRQSAEALQDAPIPQRVSQMASPEQVQIIAPAPLPIELPAAAVLKQTAPVAPAEVTRMFVAAAEAVADAVLVSSGFVNGEGQMLVRLQPEVLGGSEVQIVAKGGTLTVVVNPATQDVQTIVEANRAQFEQHLAEKVHSWRVSVAVRRGVKTDERV